MHVCCGPCSTAPLRTLQERGAEVHIHFANPNIAPADEHARRLDAARTYAKSADAPFVAEAYDPAAWAEAIGCLSEDERTSSDGITPPRERCRACYRVRFEASARYAKEHGFPALGTTLSVSPYQYADIIEEELDRACALFGITPFFEDYSPLYPETISLSKEAGLYRQDYCGCLPSKAEADEGRARRKAEREARKAARAKAREESDAAIQERREEHARYDAVQARKRAIKRALREQSARAGGDGRTALDERTTESEQTDA